MTATVLTGRLFWPSIPGARHGLRGFSASRRAASTGSDSRTRTLYVNAMRFSSYRNLDPKRPYFEIASSHRSPWFRGDRRIRKIFDEGRGDRMIEGLRSTSLGGVADCAVCDDWSGA